MPKFSGTKRRPLRTNLTAPIRTLRERIRTHEGGDAFARDAGVGPVPARRHQHGRRGHLLRARRRSRRPLRRARARGDRVEPGVPRRVPTSRRGKVGLVEYLRVDAAHALGRGRDGRRVRGRRRRRRPVGGGARPPARRRAGRAARLLADRARPQRARCRSSAASPTRCVASTPSAPRCATTACRARSAWPTSSSSPTRRRATSASRRCSSGCSTVATTTTPSPTRPCCRCWRPRPRSTRSRRTTVALVLRDQGPVVLAEAGFSWERLSGWLPGGMDAEAWEAVIPSMGVMALVRNLRNFDQAGISEPAIEAVIAKITDADEVAKARLFPYQVWSAYKHAPSDNWKRALGSHPRAHHRQHPCARRHPRGDRHVGLDAGAGVGPLDAPAGRGRRRHGDGHREAGVERRRRHLRPDQRARDAARGHVGARRRGAGGAVGRLGRSRHLRPHRHRAGGSTRSATSGWSCSPTTSSTTRATSGSTTCRSSTPSTWPATGPRRSRRVSGAATPSVASPTPRSPS